MRNKQVCLNIGLSIALVTLLSGCGPTHTNLLYKQGTTIYTKQSDIDACKIESFRVIPQTIAQHVSPGASSPGTVVCSGSGAYVSCNTVGGFYIPPSVHNYDVNQRLRTNYINQCLAKRGYTYIERPFCNDEAGYKNTDPAPAASQIKCVNRNAISTQF